MSKIQTLYNTFSFCPKCVFLNKKRIDDKKNWIPSSTVVKDHKVWYVTKCPTHGEQEFLICSNIPFFYGLFKFTPANFEVKDEPKKKNQATEKKKSQLDIEDIENRFHYKNEKISNLPFLVSVDVTEKTKPSDIQKAIDNYLIQTSKEIEKKNNKKNGKAKDFILKINGKVNHQKILNSILLKAYESNKKLQEQMIILELPFPNFRSLIRLENTCLLKPNIYPNVKIYIEKTKEKENVAELQSIFKILKQIKNMKCMISIFISRPFPDLSEILKICRKEYSICKFIVLEYERSPGQIKTNMFGKKSKHFDETDLANNNNMYELIEKIRSATSFGINDSDWVPLSYGMIGEIFLKNLGLGDFNIRPSPLCGFGTCLINTDKFKSVPLSRFIDLEKLYSGLTKILMNGNQFNNLNNLFKLVKVKDCVKNSFFKSAKIPKNLDSYLNLTSSKEDKNQAKQIIDNFQFLIVHNNMDLGCADFGRRSRCSSCHLRNNKIFSECIKAL